MTGDSHDQSGPSAATTAAGRQAPMRFSVDGWDPAYGASLELEEQLEESTATVDVDVELPADRWRAIDPDADVARSPTALLFVDGVRRIEARVWIDEDSHGTGGQRRHDGRARPCARRTRQGWCAAAGQQAHLVLAEIGAACSPSRRTRATSSPGQAGTGAPRRRAGGRHAAHGPALPSRCSVNLAEVESGHRGRGAGSAVHEHGVPGQTSDLLIIDGPLRGRQHLPRALGYIKSHRSTYLPPELNALVGTLAPGQRTPVFLMGTSWDRHSWYLRLPGPPGAPWAGVVRIECSADLPVSEVIQARGLSQSMPRQVRLSRLQGFPRSAEPLPDRRPRT